MEINPRNNISFNGLHIERCNGVHGEAKKIIDFYKITIQDEILIKRLKAKIFPVYDSIFKSAIKDFQNPKNQMYISVVDNNITGIITGKSGWIRSEILNFITFRAPANNPNTVYKKVKNSGQGLFTVLLKNSSKTKKMDVAALPRSLSDCYYFYSDNGFITVEEGAMYLVMKLKNIPKKLQEKTNELEMTFFDKTKHTNLDNLDLNIRV